MFQENSVLEGGGELRQSFVLLFAKYSCIMLSKNTK